MTKRLLLAVAFSFAVLVAYNFLLMRYYRGQVPGKEAEKETAEQPAEKRPVPTQAERGLPAGVWPGVHTERDTGSGREEVVETSLYQVVFSQQGVISHWRLKHYKESSGEIVDLAARIDTRPLDYVYGVSPLKGKRGVLLTAESGGVRILKEMVFEEERYLATLRFRVENNSPVVRDVVLFRWGPGVDRAGDMRETVFTSCFDGKVRRYRSQKIKNRIVQKEAVWSGVGSKYFAVVIFPRTKGQSLIIENKKDGPVLECAIEEIGPGAAMSGEIAIYALPKDYEMLKSEGFNLHLLVDFGMFGAIGKGIFYLMKLLYKFTKNYGLVIILLSVFIKIALFPLSRRGVKSMQDMQRIQPQIEMLRQRFKHDKEALARETMELYKRMKINPMGGCLPILLQMPVFFALFVVFQNSIELRQAPFMLWIKDLSVPDPFYVLPVLMGLTTFVQQKTTPSSSQMPGSTFMTVLITFIFLNFPAGLVLYWLVNNVLSIAEQNLIRKMA